MSNDDQYIGSSTRARPKLRIERIGQVDVFHYSGPIEGREAERLEWGLHLPPEGFALILMDSPGGSAAAAARIWAKSLEHDNRIWAHIIRAEGAALACLAACSLRTISPLGRVGNIRSVTGPAVTIDDRPWAMSGIPIESIIRMLDGRIYIGEHAEAAGIVDDVAESYLVAAQLMERTLTK